MPIFLPNLSSSSEASSSLTFLPLALSPAAGEDDRPGSRRRKVMLAPVTDVPASSGSTLMVAVMLVASTSTRSSSTSTTLTSEGEASADNAPLLDVTQFGYFKVLGKGNLPSSQRIVVKAKLVSKLAEKKIKGAGGAVLLTA
ncbi:60S ribosomal protein L27a-2 [Nymphaea thermarum]|nr:60S ribosomal protein L27a-2 [Nymphaea thermarum]